MCIRDSPYTVSVNGAGHTDSAWQVTGTITVTNPNSWQSVTLTGVSDALSDATATCTVTGDQAAAIAPLGHADFTYTCTYCLLYTSRCV